MRRHVLIGRFGSEDGAGLPIAPDEVPSHLDLVAGKTLGHGIGQALHDLKELSLFPSELGVDLLVLAAHVYAADTRLSRISESQDAWTREIRLVVPVSDPARWTAVTPIVVRALRFLTGDLWMVGFRARPSEFLTIVKVPDQPVSLAPFDLVSLFSGGLDSLIGAIDTLATGRTPLLVSHAGEGSVSKAQDLCFADLKAAYSQSAFDRLRVWMRFEHSLFGDAGAEQTTRARSFLFFALGLAAGTALNRDFVLQVPENGLIALNVPLDMLRLGALSTRTTHPFYMARWNELLAGLGISAQVENPYWNKTKGEMVSGCADPALLARLAPESLSCSSPTKARWQKMPQGHCGHCMPCLIRRAALGSSDQTIYNLANLRARVLNTNRAEGEHVRSFQLAIARLRARPELAKVLIHKSGPLYDYLDQHEEYADVYFRGLMEVGELLKGVQTAPM